ncbi:MAG: thiamine pyrophosphate-dependent dehydrogenase E1 component subunit alpha [Coriobacteriia bacterium]
MYLYDDSAPATEGAALDASELLGLFHGMLRVRMVQDRIAADYHEDEMRTPVHLCVGQEAGAVGVCDALRRDDLVFSNHRGHGHYLAKGGDLKAMIAELFCKSTGCSSGRGGSMHLVDLDAGLPGSSSIVAGGIPLATGAGFSFQMRGEDRVACVFFGDAAAEEGVFYESLNFAALKKLPVLYVCENNFFAVWSPQRARAANEVWQRAACFGIPATVVDGTDVAAVHVAAETAVAHVRSGLGPALLELRAYRWKGHSGGEEDAGKGDRSVDDLESWKAQCPIDKTEARLRDAGALDDPALARMRAEIGAEIDEAFAFAKASPLPDDSTLTDHVYADAEVTR